MNQGWWGWRQPSRIRGVSSLRGPLGPAKESCQQTQLSRAIVTTPLNNVCQENGGFKGLNVIKPTKMVSWKGWLPSGKRLHNMENHHFSMGKCTDFPYVLPRRWSQRGPACLLGGPGMSWDVLGGPRKGSMIIEPYWTPLLCQYGTFLPLTSLGSDDSDVSPTMLGIMMIGWSQSNHFQIYLWCWTSLRLLARARGWIKMDQHLVQDPIGHEFFSCCISGSWYTYPSEK